MLAQSRNSLYAFVVVVLLLTTAAFLGNYPHRRSARPVALYRAGQAAALHHHYAEAEADFRQAKALSRGDADRQAWCDYQICSLLEVQPAKRMEALRALRALIQNYPHHYLAGIAQSDLDRLEGKKARPVVPPRLDLDCGPECLQYILSHVYHRPATVAAMHRLAGTGEHGTTLLGLQKAAEAEGLRAEGVKVDAAYLRRMPKPVIAWTRRSHFVAVLGVTPTLTPPFWSLRVYDPTTNREEVVPEKEFTATWDGYMLALSKPALVALRQ